MKVQTLQMERAQAHELYQQYMAHRKCLTPADAEIAAIYRMIAAGKTVIRAVESIRAAGVNAEGLPKLAIAAADAADCWLRIERSGLRFGERWPRSNQRHNVIRINWPEFKDPGGNYYEWCATVPLIPVHLRPKQGLSNYHILWEAEWTKRYPVDPYLLRRFGGDAWVVVAAWDLTDVERAVMANRIQH